MQNEEQTQMKIYNKLVRDNIPQIINASGQKCDIEILEDDQYILMLNEKLFEEIDEYKEAAGEEIVGELADVVEIIFAIAEHHGISINTLNKVREEKSNERGGFKDKIFLEKVYE